MERGRWLERSSGCGEGVLGIVEAEDDCTEVPNSFGQDLSPLSACTSQ